MSEKSPEDQTTVILAGCVAPIKPCLGIRTCSVKRIVLITRQNVGQLSRSQTEAVKWTEISIDYDV
jgi:hypothetical protein